VDDFHFKKAKEFIDHDSRDLQAVFEKVNLLGDLNQKIEAHLDPALVKYCQASNLTNGKLTLIVANGSVATQIRYQTNDILRKFRGDPALKHITAIECKVRPEQPPLPPRLSDKPVKNTLTLSPATAEAIKSIADSITDPGLREVMTRIASHVKEKE